jgi:hypothetical protein
MFQRTKEFWRQLLGESTASATATLPNGSEDRRAWSRMPTDFETSFKPVSAAHSRSLPCRVRNISPGGINLRTNQGFTPGDMLSVELPRATSDDRFDVLACVVHCDEVDGGEWSLGCTFSRELSEVDLLAVEVGAVARAQVAHQHAVGPLGGLLAVAGGLLAGLPSRSAVDTAAASG